VLAIVVITSGVGIVRYSSSLRRYRVEIAAQRLAADIALVQTRARTSGQARSIRINETSNEYILVNEPSPDGNAKHTTVQLNVEPYLVAIAHVRMDIRGDTLTFDGYGASNAALQVKLTSGDQSRLVSVEPVSGRIHIDAP
jgi:type II secretory pathway pseudopilin PulG